MPSSEPVHVRDWLVERGVAASDIIAERVPTSFLCPRIAEPREELECFHIGLGDPPLDGLVCRQKVVPMEAYHHLNGTELVTAWRLEERKLRQVLDVHTFCASDVFLEAGTRLSISYGCTYHRR